MTRDGTLFLSNLYMKFAQNFASRDSFYKQLTLL